MARKLMSFLGTGKYQACRYELDGEPSNTVRYVQLALSELLQPQRIIVFTTPAAHDANYTGDDGLLAAARSTGMDHLFTPVLVKEGKSLEEIWNSFTAMFEHVEPGDHICFDISHSFRSIPVMGLACLQYAGTLRDVVVEGVYYGAFEAKDPETNTAPIFDLTPFVQLMDWSQAVREFAKYGQCGALKQHVWSGTSGRKDRHRNLLRTLAGDLEKTGSAIAGCRGKAIFLDPPWEKIPGHLKKLRSRSDPLLSAFDPLLDLIEAKVADLMVDGIDASEEVRRGLGAVQWCLRHDMVQQAYSILQETMITHVCLCSGLDCTDRDDRKLASASFAVSTKPREEWEGEAKARPDKVQTVCECVRPEILQLLNKFSVWRNDVMHCRHTDHDFKTLRRQLKKYFEDFLGHLDLGASPCDSSRNA